MLSFQLYLLSLLLKLLHPLKISLFLQFKFILFFLDLQFYLFDDFHFLQLSSRSLLLHLLDLGLCQGLSFTVKFLLFKNLFFLQFLLPSKRFIILLFYKLRIILHFLLMFECLLNKLLFLIIEVFAESNLR